MQGFFEVKINTKNEKIVRIALRKWIYSHVPNLFSYLLNLKKYQFLID